MNERASVYAIFEFADDVGRAISELRRAGFDGQEIDVYSPIPLDHHFHHEQDHESLEVVKKKGPKVATITRVGTALGIMVGVFLVGITPLLYPIQPIQQGGMPVIVLPPLGMMSFEAMILLSFFATVAGFLIRTGMPRSNLGTYDIELTRDRFAIHLMGLGTVRFTEAVDILQRCNAESIKGEPADVLMSILKSKGLLSE